MKKLVLFFVAITALSFVSCTSKSKSLSNSQDSISIDTTTVSDSIAADSILATDTADVD